jgi:pSer/pThr/pTyr-binding forkhead associated (FHA) protein
VFIQLTEQEPWQDRLDSTWWQLPVVIGRGLECALRINDCWASRRHCVLEEPEGGVVLRDLGSRHGTLVNRQAVSTVCLLAGDRLTVGLTTFEVGLISDVPGQTILPTVDSAVARQTQPGCAV